MRSSTQKKRRNKVKKLTRFAAREEDVEVMETKAKGAKDNSKKGPSAKTIMRTGSSTNTAQRVRTLPSLKGRESSTTRTVAIKKANPGEEERTTTNNTKNTMRTVKSRSMSAKTALIVSTKNVLKAGRNARTRESANPRRETSCIKTKTVLVSSSLTAVCPSKPACSPKLRLNQPRRPKVAQRKQIDLQEWKTNSID